MKYELKFFFPLTLYIESKKEEMELDFCPFLLLFSLILSLYTNTRQDGCSQYLRNVATKVCDLRKFRLRKCDESASVSHEICRRSPHRFPGVPEGQEEFMPPLCLPEELPALPAAVLPGGKKERRGRKKGERRGIYEREKERWEGRMMRLVSPASPAEVRGRKLQP